MNPEKREKQLRYLSQSIRLTETASPRLVRATMTVVSLSILAFLGWAAFANIHEIARTPGEVVPSGFQQVVQHLEGGMVREILVQEGDTVQKDQIVLRLDGAGIETDLRRAREQGLTLAMQEERLRAFIEKRAPVFPAEIQTRTDMLRDQESFFAGMTSARDRERAVIEEQISQKKQSIGALTADLDAAKQNFRIVSELYQKRLEMNRQGVMSHVKLLETEQSFNLLRGQIKSTQSQIAMAKSAISEYQNRLSSLDADTLDAANQRLDGILAARGQNDELIEKLQARVARLDIRAPVKGLVKGITVNTIGSVVQAGQILMEIIPSDAPLIVSIKIPPRYIGHLKPGQDVQVKCSSFDFSRYGSVRGRLDYISATTFSAENGERYFQGRVNLERNYVGEDSRNTVMPGMTVMADIITGEKTVMGYLLKPIRNALSTAFTEK
jgi:membrane fusion protein, adhesin transport system